MKLTAENFQSAVRVGAVLLFVSAAANVYLLMRHRELFQKLAQVETVVQQQGTAMALRQQLLEGLLRDFAGRASGDAGVAEIFARYRPLTNVVTEAKP